MTAPFCLEFAVVVVGPEVLAFFGVTWAVGGEVLPEVDAPGAERFPVVRRRG